MSHLTWATLTLTIGLALLIAEVFVPSGGLIGLTSAGCLCLSLYLAFRDSTGLGLLFLAAEVTLVPVVVGVSFTILPRTPLGRRVILQPPQADDLAVSHAGDALDELIGRSGWALTPLRPSGIVDFDGRRLDGLSEGGLIPLGAEVRAVRVRSGRVIVRAASPEASDVLAPEEG